VRILGFTPTGHRGQGVFIDGLARGVKGSELGPFGNRCPSWSWVECRSGMRAVLLVDWSAVDGRWSNWRLVRRRIGRCAVRVALHALVARATAARRTAAGAALAAATRELGPATDAARDAEDDGQDNEPSHDYGNDYGPLAVDCKCCPRDDCNMLTNSSWPCTCPTTRACLWRPRTDRELRGKASWVVFCDLGTIWSARCE
jgi:hypothetical protein